MVAASSERLTKLPVRAINIIRLKPQSGFFEEKSQSAPPVLPAWNPPTNRERAVAGWTDALLDASEQIRNARLAYRVSRANTPSLA
jgi:hypothetical protein